MRRVGIVAVLVALMEFTSALAAAHEERLLVGRVETIDVAHRRLVVVSGEGGERRRLDVTPETESLVCRAAPGVAVVSTGVLVRVKYVEKPGSPSRAESILVLPAAQGVPGGGR